MTKEQVTFFIYEQMPKDYVAKFLEVKVEDIEEAEDHLLIKQIETKVNEMSDEEVQQFVSQHSIS